MPTMFIASTSKQGETLPDNISDYDRLVRRVIGYDFSDIGERLPVGDMRGIIAHRHHGKHQDEWLATREADDRARRWRRPATPLEVALLVHHGILDPDNPRDITCTNTWVGAIRRQSFTAGRQELTDDRRPTESDTNV